MVVARQWDAFARGHRGLVLLLVDAPGQQIATYKNKNLGKPRFFILFYNFIL